VAVCSKPLPGHCSGYRCKSGTAATHMASPGFALYPAAFQLPILLQYGGNTGYGLILRHYYSLILDVQLLAVIVQPLS